MRFQRRRLRTIVINPDLLLIGDGGDRAQFIHSLEGFIFVKTMHQLVAAAPITRDGGMGARWTDSQIIL